MAASGTAQDTAQELANRDPGKQDLPSSEKEKSTKDVDPAGEGGKKTQRINTTGTGSK